MTALIIIICFTLVSIVLIQIGKMAELTATIKGEQETLRDNSKWNAWIGLVFMVVFLAGCILSAYAYKNQMMGYGPHTSASEHGVLLDNLFQVTLFFTGIVFVLTHIALFWFAFKYRYKEGRQAQFIAHDNRLEVWWTIIPAIVMAILVVRGLNAWNVVMSDVKEDEEYMEIEAVAQQFGWTIRYPGPDGKIGERNYKLTTGNNQLGQEFKDPKCWDDILSSGGDFYLPVNKKIRVRIIAKDVLHNFDLPHFRVKMDAVPGMPTYFVFKPTKTTTDYRNELKNYPEYHEPFDEKEPAGPKRWEKFDYELACAELCGKGHYSMRRVLKIVTQEEFDAWYKDQKSFYLSDIHNKDGKEADDPFFGKTLPAQAAAIGKELNDNIKSALDAENPAEKSIVLNYIHFDTGSAHLTDDSKYELDHLVTALSANPTVAINIAGHTDNVGEAASNQVLSKERAVAVVNYLTGKGVAASRLGSVGYGDTKPADSNETEPGRRKNRRVEFTITHK